MTFRCQGEQGPCGGKSMVQLGQTFRSRLMVVAVALLVTSERATALLSLSPTTTTTTATTTTTLRLGRMQTVRREESSAFQQTRTRRTNGWDSIRQVSSSPLGTLSLSPEGTFRLAAASSSTDSWDNGGGVSSTVLRPESSLLTRRSSPAKRKRNKKRRKPDLPNKASGKPISAQEVAEHVSNLYIHGPGGVLRDSSSASERQRRRNLQQQQQQLGSQHDENFERTLDRHPALVLNADFQPLSYLPLSLWNWQDAVKAVFSGKVTVVDVYPDVTIRAASLEVPVPSVIALTEYVPQFSQTPAFTKRNVFLRDEYRCQYCHAHFHTRDLSLDHVVPRCRGGLLQWDNAVTCCRSCNGRKGSLALKEVAQMGMKLLHTPRTPTQYELATTASRMLPRRVHPTWEPYLGFAKRRHNNNNNKVATAATEVTRESSSSTRQMELE